MRDDADRFCAFYGSNCQIYTFEQAGHATYTATRAEKQGAMGSAFRKGFALNLRYCKRRHAAITTFGKRGCVLLYHFFFRNRPGCNEEGKRSPYPGNRVTMGVRNGCGGAKKSQQCYKYFSKQYICFRKPQF